MASNRTAVARNSDALPLQIAYQAPGNCPTRNEFAVALAARLPQTDPGAFDPTRSTVPRVDVRIEGSQAQFAGFLQIHVGETVVQRRTVEDQHCAALVEALALLVALEFDKIDGQRAEPGNHAGTATDQQKQADRSRSSARDARYALRLALGAGLDTAPAPRILPSGAVHAFVASTVNPWGVGLSLKYGQTGLERFDGGDVRFRWVDARLYACPYGARNSRFALLACGTFDLGQLRAAPENTASPTPRNGWWVSAGLGALAAVRHGNFFLAGFAGVAAPFVRDKYYFARSNGVAHQPEWIGLAAELQLGVAL
jgi:hypothetical protein